VGGKGGGGGRGEKWTKPCMHIWIIKEKWKKKEIVKLFFRVTVLFAFPWEMCESTCFAHLLDIVSISKIFLILIVVQLYHIVVVIWNPWELMTLCLVSS
jgi:hypothetical protein